MERIKKMLEEAHKQREHLQYGHAVSTGGTRHQKRAAFRSLKSRLLALKDNSGWLLSGIIAGITLLIIGWWTGSGQQQDGTRLSSLPLPEPRQTSTTGGPVVEKLEARLSTLNERVEKLANSVIYLESRLESARTVKDPSVVAEQKPVSSSTPELPVVAEAEKNLETLPPPVAGVTTGSQETTVIAAAKTETSPLGKHDSLAPGGAALPDPGTDASAGEQGRLSHATTRKATTTDRQVPAAREKPADSVDKDGPWVINLVSSPSKADADRMSKKARSRDIQTEQQQAIVKGNQYWRVQITGFSTADEARTYADTTKEKLGLRDVWIMKR